MENSFSLQFNPMEKLKSLKQYEAELEALKNENFDLKHQLSYYKSTPQGTNVDEDLQKLLYESKKSIDILESENKAYQKQIESLKEIIRSNNLEKENALDEYKAKLTENDDKLLILEEENTRLLNHLENVKSKNNKFVEECKSHTQHICNLERAVEEQRNYIGKIENDNKIYFKEGEKLLNENNNIKKEYLEERNRIIGENETLKQEKNKINIELGDLKKRLNNIQNQLEEERTRHSKEIQDYEENTKRLKGILSEYESSLKLKNQEIERINEFYNEKYSKENEQYIQELQKNIIKETSEKQKLMIANESYRKEIDAFKNCLSNLEKKLEIVENEKRAMKYKISEHENLNERLQVELKNVRNEQKDTTTTILELKNIRNSFESSISMLNYFENVIRDCESRVSNYMNFNHMNDEKICDELKIFTKRLNINTKDPVKILFLFKKMYDKMRGRIEILENEVKDISTFTNNHNNNNKVFEIVKKLAEEFKNAKMEMDGCKKYLEKKSKEIKELKSQNLILENKFNLAKNKCNELRNSELKFRNSYENIINTLKRKDELISRLEMRMRH